MSDDKPTAEWTPLSISNGGYPTQEELKKDRIKAHIAEMARLYAYFPTIVFHEHDHSQTYVDFHNVVSVSMEANGFTEDQKKFVIECLKELEKEIEMELWKHLCNIKGELEDK